VAATEEKVKKKEDEKGFESSSVSVHVELEATSI
jgi:hypothetical protein